MATNHVWATYNEVVDLQTKDGNTTIIGIHTPVGSNPYIKLKGFFTQFKKFRYKGISKMMFQPASGLPIDPLGLSVVPGTTDAMDPRDTFNPILFKGCHGEHITRAFDTFMDDHEWVASTGINFSDTDEVSNSLRKKEFANIVDTHYYNCLTDKSWRKFGIQSPFTLRNLHPLVWNKVQNMPVLPTAGYGAIDGNEVFHTNNGVVRDLIVDTSNVVNRPPYTPEQGSYGPGNTTASISQMPTINNQTAYVQEFTNGCQRLGWLPTTTYVQEQAGEGNLTAGTPRITGLPKLFMGLLVLPPSYSVEQFMRCVITHVFEFAGFTTSTAAMDPAGILEPSRMTVGNYNTSYYNFIDYQTSKGDTLDVFNGESKLVSDGVA